MARPVTSNDPKNIRKRLRYAGTKVNLEARKLLADARKPLEEWDNEELARGRPRDKDGHFRGRLPVWVTPVVMAEAKRRLILGAFADLNSYVTGAIQVVYRLMMDDSVDDNGKPIVDSRTRLDAAKFIIEHVIGKPTSHVEIEDGTGWKTSLAGAMKVRDQNGKLTDAHPIVDLEDDEWTDGDDDG